MLKFGLRLAFWLLPFLFAAVTATKEVAESYFPNLSSADKTDYNSWLNLNFGTSYARHSFLASTADPDLGAAVFWNIDGDEINFAVAVRAEGWLSFGISEAGGMLGADVVQFETLKPSQLIDSYVLEDRAAPLTDDCQNWNLISTTINNGWIILEINRKLDTQDSQDHKIANDQALFIAPTRLIAAWGDQSVVSFHGLNRARNAVRLFAEDSVSVSEALKETLEQNSDSFFDVREDNHQISTAETDYHVVCKTFTQIQQEIGTSQSPLTVVGAIPVISEGSAEFIHHFTVYTQADCSTGISTRSMIYAWAPGNEGWTLPDDVGFSMFDGANRQAVSVEIHYNNPSGISGKTDSSGTRFYYSEEERPQKAAILELGDPSMALNGEAINNGLTQYEFTCPGACSSTFFGGTSVTVLAEFLHMHRTGVRMTNEVLRSNQVVHESKIDVFEFDQQGGFFPQQEPYEVSPGDSFRTSCYYRDGASFGLSSQEEMCIAYVLYYPVKSYFDNNWLCPYGLPVPVCSPELTYRELQNDEELDRSFGSLGSVCPTTSVSPPPTLSPSKLMADTPSALPSKLMTDTPSALPSSIPGTDTPSLTPTETPSDATTFESPSPSKSLSTTLPSTTMSNQPTLSLSTTSPTASTSETPTPFPSILPSTSSPTATTSNPPTPSLPTSSPTITTTISNPPTDVIGIGYLSPSPTELEPPSGTSCRSRVLLIMGTFSTTVVLLFGLF